MLLPNSNLFTITINKKGEIIESADNIVGNISSYIAPMFKYDFLNRIAMISNGAKEDFNTVLYDTKEIPVIASTKGLLDKIVITFVKLSLTGYLINPIAFVELDYKNSFILSTEIDGKNERLMESIEFFTKSNKYDLVIYPEHVISFISFTRNVRNEYERYFQMYIKGELRWGSLMLFSLSSTSDHILFGAISDITDHIESQIPIIKKSFRDPLTNTLPKDSIIQYVNDYISIYNDTQAALIILDVDYFKQINDTYGHSFGDTILKQIVNVIKSQLNEYPGAQIGRYGGDEFLIFIPNVTSYVEVKDLASKIRHEVIKIYYDEIKSFSVTISQGIARYPLDGKNFEELIKKADKALYRGKMKGRDCYVIYDEMKCGDIDPTGAALNLSDIQKKLKLSTSTENDVASIIFNMSIEPNMDDSINRALTEYATLLKLDRIIVRYKGHEFIYGNDRYPIVEGYTSEAINNYKDYFVNGELRENNTNILSHKNKAFKQLLIDFGILAFDMYRITDENDNFEGFISYEMCGSKRTFIQSDIEAFKNLKNFIIVYMDKYIN